MQRHTHIRIYMYVWNWSAPALSFNRCSVWVETAVADRCFWGLTDGNTLPFSARLYPQDFTEHPQCSRVGVGRHWHWMACCAGALLTWNKPSQLTRGDQFCVASYISSTTASDAACEDEISQFTWWLLKLPWVERCESAPWVTAADLITVSICC